MAVNNVVSVSNQYFVGVLTLMGIGSLCTTRYLAVAAIFRVLEYLFVVQVLSFVH